MKLHTETVKNSRNKDKLLIKYFDMRLLSINEILETDEAVSGGLNSQVIRYRLSKVKTLEELLEPKQKYLFKTETEIPKKVKIKGTFSIPGVYKKPLVTKEIEIDKEEYNEIKNKSGLVEQLFIHAISDKIEVECVRVR